jgi:hypothetical protein
VPLAVNALNGGVPALEFEVASRLLIHEEEA